MYDVNVTITEPTELTLSAQTINPICSTGLGTVIGVSNGGTPQYTYSIDGGATQSSPIFNNVSAGAHTISVIDANGCQHKQM
ncbi:MAG: hypothetical protein R2798_06865 [Chitinophagales bacterium]